MDSRRSGERTLVRSAATARNNAHLRTVEAYDPVTDTWTVEASIPTPEPLLLSAW